MPPTASILIPTRGRPEYLSVALASVAPQAAAAGAEIVVVEDGEHDERTAALARAHGARYVAHGRRRGVNAARNSAIAEARADLLCLVDDDVEVWPGWLRAIFAAAEACPQHEAFGGPIRARLEGWRWRVCGNEPPPITTLDLGPSDCDTDVAWGANLALRRRALERVGPFDPALSGEGDEEEWERRLRAVGGRIRYVAAAGVDHRRCAQDSGLADLVRAAYARGRRGRRWDRRKRTAPGVLAELRQMTACAVHIPRRRCVNGVLVLAQSAGRVRELLAERRG